MKIAFTTISDPRDIRRGSGTPYYLWQELVKQGCTVHLLGPLDLKIPLCTRLLKWISKIQGKKYFSYRDPFTGKVIGKEVQKKLKVLDYDILLTNDYSIAAYTHSNKPIFLYTDDTFPYDYSKNQHPWLSNLSFISVYFCQSILRGGVKHSKKCIFAAFFAAEEANKYIQGDYPTIPYGANIDAPKSIIPKNFQVNIQKNSVDLLFVGKDWYRKGGDIAVETVRILNYRGVSACLHVVGVNLPASTYSETYIKMYGVLNKDNMHEKKILYDLFSTCDALILPSKIEGYGLVYVEAASFGMPSLAFKTSGVSTSVISGKSGVLFDLTDSAIAFADQIELWMQYPDIYNTLSKSARVFFETTANWKVAVSRLLEEIRDSEFC